MTKYCFSLFLACLCLALSNCGDSGTTATDVSTSPAPASAPASTPAPDQTSKPITESGNSSPYPSIEIPRLEYLWDNATYMDATFYNLPISINQSELPQIRSTLSGIGVEPAEIKPGCAPAGHVWFQVNGKNVEEADLYFQAGCTFYVWYEDGKPAYSNKLTLDGVQFYQNIINSVKEKGL